MCNPDGLWNPGPRFVTLLHNITGFQTHILKAAYAGLLAGSSQEGGLWVTKEELQLTKHVIANVYFDEFLEYFIFFL